VVTSFLGGKLASELEHRRCHVDAGRMSHVRRERTEHDAAAAGDVEHGVVRPRSRRGDDAPQRLLVGEARRDVEHFGLTRELIDNRAVMCGLAHVPALLVMPTKCVLAHDISRCRLTEGVRAVQHGGGFTPTADVLWIGRELHINSRLTMRCD
jgi:hypothetical protein